jgi:hypothetical protein
LQKGFEIAQMGFHDFIPAFGTGCAKRSMLAAMLLQKGYVNQPQGLILH